MALYPETRFPGQIAAGDTDYPYGSAQNVTTAGDGTGTPFVADLVNDKFGEQQALLRADSQTPTNTPDTATDSQYLQSINALVAGRANTYTESGAANAYVLGLNTGQQKIAALFDGMQLWFTASNDNTGASTLDVSAVLGQSTGTTVVGITTSSGSETAAGTISGRVLVAYNSTAARFELIPSGAETYSVTGTATFTNSTQNINLPDIGAIEGLEVGDVLQVSGSTSNDTEYTVESITDDDNVIVNYEHRGGTTSKSLTDETGTSDVTIRLLCKWYNAPIGLGQDWVDVTSSRAKGTNYSVDLNRSIAIIYTGTFSTGNADSLLTDAGTISYASGNSSTDIYQSLNGIVVGNYQIATTIGNGGSKVSWFELR